ncbi:MAG: hypothetical protein A2Y54_05625 [Chloroflexi bacterium RBG_16_51_16]|nr:MAG: hypothetical protein A2Y54_05625 [Chloroflexi bacterium RBG_16_51_16]
MTGLLWIAASLVLLLILALWNRRSPRTYRDLPALARLKRELGYSVEAGTRLHIGLGHANLISSGAGSSLASLAMLRQLSERTSVGDLPPVASSGEASLALLSQDTLKSGYDAAGAPELFEPTTGRLVGLSPLGYAAGLMPLFQVEPVSTLILSGRFGAEAGLIVDSAERAHATVLGASDDLAAQSVLFASSHEPLIGEELFAASAYLGGSPSHTASLTVQDVMRWFVILVLLGGAAARLMGVI